MHDPTTLAAATRSALPLLTRYLEGFGDETRCAQPAGLVNHASWTVGHIALTMHRAADRVEGFDESQPLPTADWVAGDGTAGDPSRYDTESVGYGSRPVPQASRYPRWTRSMEILHASAERLASLTQHATPAGLARETAWGSGRITAGDLVTRMIFHNGVHTGQIIAIRHALGMNPVTG